MLCWSKTTHKLQAQLSTACKQVQSKEVEPERLACVCQPTGDCFRLFHTANRVNDGRADRGYMLIYIECPGYDATSCGIWKHAYATYWCPLHIHIRIQHVRIAFHQTLRPHPTGSSWQFASLLFYLLPPNLTAVFGMPDALSLGLQQPRRTSRSVSI